MTDQAVIEQADIKVRRVQLTAQTAMKLLKRNTHNRALSMPRVDQYATDMLNGNWAFNGEAIKVAHDGQILDGQHRLEAVAQSGVTVETLLITGLEPEAQETMDQGRARTLADVLKLRGEGDYNVLAAAVRAVCFYERDGLPFKDAFKPAPTVHECLRALDRNPEIRDSVKLAAELRRGSLLPSSTVGALHFLFATVSDDDARDFWTKLLRGEDLSSSSPIYVLRDRLLIDLRERALPPKVKLAFVIRTWNAYRQGEPLRRLLWTAGGANPDRFPAIDGLVDKRTPAPDAETEPESQGGGSPVTRLTPHRSSVRRAATSCGSRRRRVPAGSATTKEGLADV